MWHLKPQCVITCLNSEKQHLACKVSSLFSIWRTCPHEGGFAREFNPDAAAAWVHYLPRRCVLPPVCYHLCVTCVFWGGIWDEPATWTSCSSPRTSSGGSAWRGGGWSEAACPRLLSGRVCGHLGNQKCKVRRGWAAGKTKKEKKKQSRSAWAVGRWSPAA